MCGWWVSSGGVRTVTLGIQQVTNNQDMNASGTEQSDFSGHVCCLSFILSHAPPQLIEITSVMVSKCAFVALGVSIVLDNHTHVQLGVDFPSCRTENPSNH